MKIDKAELFHRAWNTYHAERQEGRETSFGECLRRSWATMKAKVRNAEAIKAAKEAAGITEEVRTWSQWKEEGREVIHGSHNLFQVTLERTSKPGKTYTASYFGYSQTTDQPQEEAA